MERKVGGGKEATLNALHRNKLSLSFLVEQKKKKRAFDSSVRSATFKFEEICHTEKNF